jgi:hypothetical protein
MKFSLWTEYGARNSHPVFKAMTEAIIRLGHTYEENDRDCDVDVIWSVLWAGRMAPNKAIYNNGKPTIVLEVGGIQRNQTWKVGLNGIDRAHLMTSHGNDGARAHMLGLELTSWSTVDDYILVCCQNPKSDNWLGMPTAEWARNTVETIRMHSDRPIVIRPHPRAPFRAVLPPSYNATIQHPAKVLGTYDDFDLTFKHAHAVVSWSSNPGPQAIVAGVPAFVGPKSLAWDVANHNLNTIETPTKPDRTQWLNDYAHTEYTTDEVAQGKPLKYLINHLTHTKS